MQRTTWTSQWRSISMVLSCRFYFNNLNFCLKPLLSYVKNLVSLCLQWIRTQILLLKESVCERMSVDSSHRITHTSIKRHLCHRWKFGSIYNSEISTALFLSLQFKRGKIMLTDWLTHFWNIKFKCAIVHEYLTSLCCTSVSL